MKRRECCRCWWLLHDAVQYLLFGRVTLASSVQGFLDLMGVQADAVSTLSCATDRLAVCRPWKKKRRKNSRCHLWPGVYMDISLLSSSA